MYKLLSYTGYILRTVDSTYIPMNEDNANYAEYLKWLEAGNTPEPADEFVPSQAAALLEIDNKAGLVVKDVVGERTEEYRQTEDDATAWKNSGYLGEVPDTVAVWAEVSKTDPKSACLYILEQAQQWRDALVAIRSARLKAKARAQDGEIKEALQDWNAFENQIRESLGVPSP